MYNPQLETFIRVADIGSFNKAAEESNITPSAVIKQINLLEADLDLQLFVRTHRGLMLTKAGESLYRDAKYIIQYCKDSVVRAGNAMLEDTNIIRIGTSPITPAQILVELWPKIQEYCPDIKFQLIPFENTMENAREILKNLGKNIDIVSGIFDDTLLTYRECSGIELTRQPLCCAVSLNHKLANRTTLKITDLYGENLMLLKRDQMSCIDRLRADLRTNHPQINLVDFEIYNVAVFNRCENENDVLLVTENWKNVHPLLKIIPVDWNYTMPFGLLHAPSPSPIVQRLLTAIQAVMQ